MTNACSFSTVQYLVKNRGIFRSLNVRSKMSKYNAINALSRQFSKSAAVGDSDSVPTILKSAVSDSSSDIVPKQIMERNYSPTFKDFLRLQHVNEVPEPDPAEPIPYLQQTSNTQGKPRSGICHANMEYINDI